MADTCTDCDPAPSNVTAVAPAAAPAPTPADAAAATASASEAASASAALVIEPPALTYPHVLIEFCDRCRWAPRASWTQTELLLTFPPPLIKSVTLQPMNSPESGGRFRVWVDVGAGAGWVLAWDRKTEGGFPELKVLKQRIRNHVQPEMDLGHSDKKSH